MTHPMDAWWQALTPEQHIDVHPAVNAPWERQNGATA